MNTNWKSTKTEHYIFHYKVDSLAERELEEIISLQESCFKEITDTLKEKDVIGLFDISLYDVNMVKKNVTNKEIEESVKSVLMSNLKNNLVPLPSHFDVEIQYKKFNDAYNASFYPGCKLISTDTVLFSTDDYYEVVRALKFIL